MTAPVRADQDAELREAWAYLTPHPYADGPIVLTPSKMRAAIATLRAAFEAERYETAEWAQATDLQVAENATLRAERDQLAADLHAAPTPHASHKGDRSDGC